MDTQPLIPTGGALDRFLRCLQSQRSELASAPSPALTALGRGSKEEPGQEKQEAPYTDQGPPREGGGGTLRGHARPLPDKTPFEKAFPSCEQRSVISVCPFIAS